MPLTASDLTVRSDNSSQARLNSNSFVSLTDAIRIADFRLDGSGFVGASEDSQVKALASSYEEIRRLPWGDRRFAQNRDYESADLISNDVDYPPLEDPEALVAIKKAQVVQAIYLMTGAPVRDMQRQNIVMSAALSGSEMAFAGYRGAVCVEVIELLGPWLELTPRTKRMA